MRLAAGPLRLDYDAGDLRCIRAGDEEIVRRIYVAFQDRNWTARPWIIENDVVEADDHSFRIRVHARGTFDAAAFTWIGTFTGSPEGTIDYAIEGATEAPFLRNRLGICVLHPMAGFAGRSCTIEHIDGSLEATLFPDEISPHQPFLDVRAMTYPVSTAGTARLRFTGEVFETEDHRNWSDASYKTYCTPIALPFPVEVRPGDAIAQSVTVAVDGVAPPTRDDAGAVTITVDDVVHSLPAIGTQATELPWTPEEVAAISDLRLDHLLVTLDRSALDPAQQLLEAAALARATRTRLRVRIVDADATADRALAIAVPSVEELVDSWMVLRSDEKVTSPHALAQAREALGTHLPWCVGTDHYFTEVNRQPPDLSTASWLSFSLNPQVHAHDDRSIVQNSAAQEVIAANARRMAGSARIHVGPVSLRPRFNPNATDPASDVSSTDLPSTVDARQRTWLGAAWTALSLRSLAVADCVDAVTYFEALGWRGLRERDQGSTDPAAFPSRAGEEFPVYGLLRELSDATGVLATRSDQPEVADALVVTTAPASARAIVINLDAAPLDVLLTGAVSTRVAIPAHSLATVDLPLDAPRSLP